MLRPFWTSSLSAYLPSLRLALKPLKSLLFPLLLGASRRRPNLVGQHPGAQAQGQAQGQAQNYMRGQIVRVDPATGAVTVRDASGKEQTFQTNKATQFYGTDRQLLKALEGHTAWVEGVTFLAHGTRLASVGADRTVKLWDLAAPAK